MASGRGGARDELVDVDDPDTWPDDVIELVEEWHTSTPATDYTSDLDVDLPEEERIREALVECKLRAYHCTRLLPHETDGIRLDGLRVFSRKLFDDRIRRAAHFGALTPAQADELLACHMCAGREGSTRGRRANQVCLVLGRSVFDHHVSGVSALLGMWGGEGIYFSSGAGPHRRLLESLGTPAIVVAGIPVLPRDEHRQSFFPSLHKVFLGVRRRLVDVGADVFHPTAIPGADIVDIWQPGNPEYDRHPQLPT